MAETPVTLLVKDFEPREVQSFSYSFNQAVDKENQPSGIPRGGQIKITVKAFNKANYDLLNWMLDQSMKKDGKITFMQSIDVKSKLKDIEFYEAYCVDYKEEWADAVKDGGVAHTETITISCKGIKNGTLEFKNEWK
jgi:hypothetical protein